MQKNVLFQVLALIGTTTLFVQPAGAEMSSAFYIEPLELAAAGVRCASLLPGSPRQTDAY